MTSLILSTVVILTTSKDILLPSEDSEYVPATVLDVERINQRDRLMREGGRKNNLDNLERLHDSEEVMLEDTSHTVSSLVANKGKGAVI